MPSIEIPKSDTTYMCLKVELPNVEEPNHIIFYEPSRSSLLLTLVLNTTYVHHLVVYDCEREPDFDVDICSRVDSSPCRGISYTWGVGGGPFALPPHVGVPMGPGAPKVILSLFLISSLSNWKFITI